MADQNDPVPRGPLTGLRSVLPRLAKRYKVPLKVIADGNGEIAQRRRDWRATEILSTKDLADEPVSRDLRGHSYFQ
jgi:hypothetical protein